MPLGAQLRASLPELLMRLSFHPIFSENLLGTGSVLGTGNRVLNGTQTVPILMERTR